jgi:hypothetical protein
MKDEAERKRKLVYWIQNSQFLAAAVLLHVIAAIILAGTYLIRPIIMKKPFEPTTLIGGDGGAAAPPPPPPAGAPSTETATPDATAVNPTTEVPINSVISVASASVPNVAPVIAPPMPAVNAPTVGEGGTGNQPGVRDGQVGGIPSGRAQQIRAFTSGWVKGGGGDGNPRGLVAEFVCYVGKLSSGSDSLVYLRVNDQQQIYGGSVPNLNEMINRFSKGRIKARLEGSALRLDSNEIFEKKPPYIFITGRKDFRFTEGEVENLRKYLIMGGCIWGDAALPGRRSPFDIAFRREMKRVIPDADKNFEPLPADHDIYKRGFFPIGKTPTGMNFHKEPVECIKIDGVEAVVYTMNGYGALWQVTFDDSLTNIDSDVMTQHENSIYIRRAILYRNWSNESLLDSYKLGINMTAYLLTRYQRKLSGI